MSYGLLKCSATFSALTGSTQAGATMVRGSLCYWVHTSPLSLPVEALFLLCANIDAPEDRDVMSCSKFAVVLVTSLSWTLWRSWCGTQVGNTFCPQPISMQMLFSKSPYVPSLASPKLNPVRAFTTCKRPTNIIVEATFPQNKYVVPMCNVDCSCNYFLFPLPLKSKKVLSVVCKNSPHSIKTSVGLWTG